MNNRTRNNIKETPEEPRIAMMIRAAGLCSQLEIFKVLLSSITNICSPAICGFAILKPASEYMS